MRRVRKRLGRDTRRTEAGELRHTLRFRDQKLSRLKSLGVTPDQLRSAPDISSLLKESDVGIKGAIAALRFSPDPVAKAFLEKYDSIAAAKAHQIPLEAVAIAAGVEIPHLLGAIQLAVREHSVNRVKLMATSRHPKVLEATLKYAMKPGGVQDRKQVHEALGFLPTSQKNSNFISRVIIQRGRDEDEPEELETELDNVFPDISRMQEKLVPLRTKLLES